MGLVKYTLRPYQKECVDKLWDSLKTPGVHPLVVVPTGGGKSLILSGFCKRALTLFSDTKILVLTHVKELVEQDAEKLTADLGHQRVGVYSAGLKRRELGRSVTVAGVQSIAHRINELGAVDLVIIDEAHLVPKTGEGRYRKVIEALKVTTPHLRVIGLTATPYRLGGGMLSEGKGRIFTDIVVEITIPELIDAGYLSPIRTKFCQSQPDLAGVKKSHGDYVAKDMAAALDQEDLINDALDEVDAFADDRKSLLFFCASIAHAESVRDALIHRGYEVDMVTGKTKAPERADVVERFRLGHLRALVNVGVFTTGFDAPRTDCVVLMRATLSPGLFYQMAGRGLRPFPDKDDCLILDFGNNVMRHGPIDAINVAQSGSGARGDGDAPCRVCPVCLEVSPLAALECGACGFEFPIIEKDPHEAVASSLAMLSRDQVPQVARVRNMTFARHSKTDKPDSLRVTYVCGLRSFSEWVCFEHPGFARTKAQKWWKSMAKTDPPATVGEALCRIEEIRMPSEIQVQRDGKYDRVIAARWKGAA